MYQDLWTELYKIAKSPQARLTSPHRKIFDLYLRDFHESAEHGSMMHIQYHDTPNEVSEALFANGFSEKLVGGEKFYSWETPKGELSMHFYNISSSPWASLSEEDKSVYFSIVEEAKKIANEGKFLMKIPSSTSLEVLKVLGIKPIPCRKADIYLCWESD